MHIRKDVYYSSTYCIGMCTHVCTLMRIDKYTDICMAFTDLGAIAAVRLPLCDVRLEAANIEYLTHGHVCCILCGMGSAHGYGARVYCMAWCMV